MKKVTKEELDYLFSRIDWGKSFLDAKAIDIMNRTDTLFEDEAREALEAKSKSCENCNHYKNIDSYMPSLLECSMKISQHPSDSYFLVDEDFCCNKHEPK